MLFNDVEIEVCPNIGKLGNSHIKRHLNSFRGFYDCVWIFYFAGWLKPLIAMRKVKTSTFFFYFEDRCIEQSISKS